MSRHDCGYPLRPPHADATVSELEAWLAHARSCPTHAPLLVRAEEAERESALVFGQLFEKAGLVRPGGELVVHRPMEPQVRESTAVTHPGSRGRRRGGFAAAALIAAAVLYFVTAHVVDPGAPPPDAGVPRGSARPGVPPPVPPQSERCSADDEIAVKAALYESQTFETLDVYSDPANFRPETLDRYWVRPEDGGLAAETVQKTVRRLVEQKLRYGAESACEQFDVVSLRFFDGCTSAEVATKERWNLPVYRADGSIHRKPNVLITQPVYWMVRRDGRWLLLKNTTPYKK